VGFEGIQPIAKYGDQSRWTRFGVTPRIVPVADPEPAFQLALDARLEHKVQEERG
jgi:hypothetical protein